MEPSAPQPSAPHPAIEWSLERRPHGRLDFLDAQGRVHADVDVLRAFPVSDPLGPVAVVGEDDAELAWIESLATVEPRLRAMLEEELGRREFLPVIQRIEAISEGEPAEWSVVTDRGRHRFRVGHADDILRLPDSSALVTDTFGLRYAISSIARLDSRSRRLLERAE